MVRKEKNWRPGGEKLAPSVSVKDRSLSGPVIELNCTSRMPGVGGSRNR